MGRYVFSHCVLRYVLPVERRQTGDVVQLVEALRDKKILESVGGPDYLVRLAESVPSAANAPHYARIVADKARLRRLIAAARSEHLLPRCFRRSRRVD